jgi:hypothetical protein
MERVFACADKTIIDRSAGAALLLALAGPAYVTATADDPVLPAGVTVIVLPDADRIETALTGTHVVQMRLAGRLVPGQSQMSIVCVPRASAYF